MKKNPPESVHLPVGRCHPAHDGAIREYILNRLGTQQIRVTPKDLLRALGQRWPHLHRNAFREVIKKLVSEGSLVHTNHLSTTHLELNFHRPVPVSKRLWFCPARCSLPVDASEECVAIKLHDGAAFGVGDHPTTRLCLQGLDAALSEAPFGDKALSHTMALDIGTGSGVLAIGAKALGVDQVLGVDIDPVACEEARSNAALNQMSESIRIEHRQVHPEEPQRYHIILANLRPPTLKKLIPIMKKISQRPSLWVVSGFRTEDKKRVMAMLPGQDTQLKWQGGACHWGAFVALFS